VSGRGVARSMERSDAEWRGGNRCEGMRKGSDDRGEPGLPDARCQEGKGSTTKSGNESTGVLEESINAREEGDERCAERRGTCQELEDP
jgi:hypothetical protein